MRGDRVGSRHRLVPGIVPNIHQWATKVTQQQPSARNRTGRKLVVFGLFSIHSVPLKSRAPKEACGFDPHPRHFVINELRGTARSVTAKPADSSISELLEVFAQSQPLALIVRTDLCSVKALGLDRESFVGKTSHYLSVFDRERNLIGADL